MNRKKFIMKVFVKKEDKMQSLVTNIIVTIIFIVAPSCVYYSFFKGLSSGKDIAELLSAYAVLLLFATIFFVIGLVLLFILLRGPKKYRATLVEKVRETYEGEEVDYMTFYVINQKSKSEDNKIMEYKCYTPENNNLVQGCDYTIKVWDYTYEIKSVEVEALDNSVVEAEPEGSELKASLKGSINIVYLIVGIFFAGQLAICILGIILYPEYLVAYIGVGSFFAIGVYYAYKMLKK